MNGVRVLKNTDIGTFLQKNWLYIYFCHPSHSAKIFVQAIFARIRENFLVLGLLNVNELA